MGKRPALVDLKQKFPSLDDKGDEELLVDKEELVQRLEVHCVVPPFFLK